MIGIYKIEIQGRHYVGKSVDITRRITQHERSDTNLGRDMRQFGYSFEVLEQCKKYKLNSREIFWISQFNSFEEGYNQTMGGSNTYESSIRISGTNKKFWKLR